MTAHLFRHTYHGQRGWLWMLWLTSVIQGVLATLDAASEPIQIARLIIFFGQCFTAAFAIVGGIHADPVESTRAFWLTRPVTRAQMLAAKLWFVSTLVLVPFLISLGIGWLRAGFTGPQLGVVLLEWTLYAGVAATLVAAVATHTGNLGGFLGVAGGLVGLVFCWGALFNYVVFRSGLFGRRGLPWNHADESSTLLVSLLLLLLGALLAWIIRARGTSFRPSAPFAVVPLLALFPLMTFRPFHFLRPAEPGQAGAQVEIIRESQISREVPAGEQLLWTHFRVSGVPTNAIVVPTRLAAELHATNDFRVRFAHYLEPHEQTGLGRLGRIKDSGVRNELFRTLRARYPAGTSWSGDWYGPNRDHLPIAGEVRGPWPRPPVGRFEGRLAADLIAVERIADLPLLAGSEAADGHTPVRLGDVRPQTDGLRFEVCELLPNLYFTTVEDDRTTRNWTPSFLYVLHHAGSGEAHLLSQSSLRMSAPAFLNCQSLRRLTFQVPRATLRERLTGHRADDWADGLRLHVYRPRTLGVLAQEFSLPDYHFVHNRAESVRMADENLSGLARLRQLRWPGATNAIAAREYVSEFLRHAPENYYGTQAREVARLLEGVGSEVVPFLLAAAPFSAGFTRMVLRSTLPGLVREEHRAALVAALARDPGLAWLSRAKQWEPDAVAPLARIATAREQPLPADALGILAANAPPAMFADLAWHAARCANGHELVLRPLRDRPGFPFAETVRAAWKRARLGIVSGTELAPFAAALGELEALHAVVRQLDATTDEARERRLLESLGSVIDFPGPDAARKSWLLEHAARLKFDAATSRYVIAG